MPKPACIAQHIGPKVLQEGHCYQLESPSTGPQVKKRELRLYRYETRLDNPMYRYPKSNMYQDYAFDIGDLAADPVLTEMENGKKYNFNSLIKELQTSNPNLHSVEDQRRVAAMFVQFEIRSLHIRHALEDYADNHILNQLKDLKNTPTIKADFLNKVVLPSRYAIRDLMLNSKVNPRLAHSLVFALEVLGKTPEKDRLLESCEFPDSPLKDMNHSDYYEKVTQISGKAGLALAISEVGISDKKVSQYQDFIFTLKEFSEESGCLILPDSLIYLVEHDRSTVRTVFDDNFNIEIAVLPVSSSKALIGTRNGVDISKITLKDLRLWAAIASRHYFCAKENTPELVDLAAEIGTSSNLLEHNENPCSITSEILGLTPISITAMVEEVSKNLSKIGNTTTGLDTSHVDKYRIIPVEREIPSNIVSNKAVLKSLRDPTFGLDENALFQLGNPYPRTLNGNYSVSIDEICVSNFKWLCAF